MHDGAAAVPTATVASAARSAVAVAAASRATPPRRRRRRRRRFRRPRPHPRRHPRLRRSPGGTTGAQQEPLETCSKRSSLRQPMGTGERDAAEQRQQVHPARERWYGFQPGQRAPPFTAGGTRPRPLQLLPGLLRVRRQHGPQQRLLPDVPVRHRQRRRRLGLDARLRRQELDAPAMPVHDGAAAVPASIAVTAASCASTSFSAAQRAAAVPRIHQTGGHDAALQQRRVPCAPNSNANCQEANEGVYGETTVDTPTNINCYVQGGGWTVDECKTACCDAMDLFPNIFVTPCKSFEYHKVQNRCNLQMVSAFEAPDVTRRWRTLTCTARRRRRRCRRRRPSRRARLRRLRFVPVVLRPSGTASATTASAPPKLSALRRATRSKRFSASLCRRHSPRA